MNAVILRNSSLRRWAQRHASGKRCISTLSASTHARGGREIPFSSSSATMTAVTAAALTIALPMHSLCEEAPTPSSAEPTQQTETSSTPLWPDGVPEADVDALVEEFMQDPSIDLTLVPDAIESRIYKSTILLTLNVFYRMLSSLHGTPILAHEVQLTRSTKLTPKLTKRLIQQSKLIDERVLEEVADRLLANPTINSTMIPDSVERQIYINCLKVIFRLLMVITNSFRITICGHDIRLALEPSTLESSALTASSSLSKIDMQLLQDFALEAGVKEHSVNDLSMWDRLWNRCEFAEHLNASLYGLVLGIVDDIMANTKIQILSDDIDLDIVPAKPRPKQSDENDTLETKDRGSDNDSASVGSFAAASFAAGVGLGVTAMAFLTSQR